MTPPVVERLVCFVLKESPPGQELMEKGWAKKVWIQNRIQRKSKSTKLCFWVGSGILDRWIMLIRPFFVCSSTFRGIISKDLSMSLYVHYHTLIKHSFLIRKQRSKQQSNVSENSIATPTLPVWCFQQRAFPPLWTAWVVNLAPTIKPRPSFIDLPCQWCFFVVKHGDWQSCLSETYSTSENPEVGC